MSDASDRLRVICGQLRNLHPTAAVPDVEDVRVVLAELDALRLDAERYQKLRALGDDSPFGITADKLDAMMDSLPPGPLANHGAESADTPRCEGGVKVELNDLLSWLRSKLAESRRVLTAREQAEETWRGGTDESWRAVSTLPRSERLKMAEWEDRIAARHRIDVAAFEQLVAIVEQSQLTPGEEE